MIQTYKRKIVDTDVNWHDLKQFNWHTSFRSTPICWGFGTDYQDRSKLGGQNAGTPGTVSISVHHHVSTGSLCKYNVTEWAGHNQQDVWIQFIAFGRWK